MLDELMPYLGAEKRKDLVQRLNSKDPEQSLGAEAELSIAWSLRAFDLEIEPVWWTPPKCPDLYVEGLIEDTPLVIEVTAFADAAVSGEDVMDHCTQALISLANAEKKGFGEQLYFHFAETRSYQRGRNERGIAASKDYKPSELTRQRIAAWINSSPSEKQRLRIEDAGLVVDVEIKRYKQTRYHNYHVSRPPRTYSDTRNPLHRRLADKSKQLRDAPLGVWRTIFLIEAGSRFLADVNNAHRWGGVEQYSTARQIIQKFIQDKSDKVDSVVVFVPTKHHPSGFGSCSEHNSSWQVFVFGHDNPVNNSLPSALEMLTSVLPRPRLDGFNARSLIRQQAMSYDARGWYLSWRWSMQDDKYTYRMSARAFQDFLAQRINEKQFRRYVGAEEDGPSIGRFLEQGFTIQDIRFESGGTDEDDDYVVFELALDAAASPFQ